MKQLPNQFTKDNHSFTQIRRSDRAALYKKETLEGQFVTFEVFAIKTKNDQEIYPNGTAFGRGILTWAWSPNSNERADVYFDRLDKGEVILANVDPETGDVQGEAEQPVVQVTLPVTPEVSLVSDTEGTVTDIVQPPSTEVQTKPTGQKLVVVAKVDQKGVTFNFPAGEFTQADFARANGLPERGVVWGKLDKLVQEKVLKKTLKKLGRGRPSQVFVKIEK